MLKRYGFVLIFFLALVTAGVFWKGSRDVPRGAVMAFNRDTCPSGWVPADGGKGTPDLRGRFIKGLNAGRELASFEPDEIRSHTHGGVMRYPHDAAFPWSVGQRQKDASDAAYSDYATVTDPAGGSETRPANIALLYCQKA